MTTLTIGSQCPRCGGWLDRDRELGELFCVPCGHRPSWTGSISIVSNTASNFTGSLPTGPHEFFTRKECPSKPLNKHEYSCLISGNRIKWPRNCIWASCSFFSTVRGYCRGHSAAIIRNGEDLPQWEHAAARKIGWVTIEYDLWEVYGKTFTRVTHVKWPKEIPYSDPLASRPINKKFTQENGYNLGRLYEAIQDGRIELVED